MKAIYRYYEDFCRMGELHGLFVADTEDVEGLLEKEPEFYLGELLGKHSEVYGSLNRTTLTEVSRKPEDVKWFEDLRLAVGINVVACALEWEDEPR